jgi:hypothetical protein
LILLGYIEQKGFYGLFFHALRSSVN